MAGDGLPSPLTKTAVDRLYTDRVSRRLSAAPGTRPSSHAEAAYQDMVMMFGESFPGAEMPEYLAAYGDDPDSFSDEDETFEDE